MKRSSTPQPAVGATAGMERQTSSSTNPGGVATSSSTRSVSSAAAARFLFRKHHNTNNGSTAPMRESSSAREEEEEEEKQNFLDEESRLPAQFEQFHKRLELCTTIREIAQLRNDVLEWARKSRKNNTWNLNLYGPKLNLLLTEIKEADQQLQAENMEIIEAPEMTKILSDDPYQHQCDLYVFLRVLVGWCFVFLLCQVPWLVVIIVFRSANDLDDNINQLDELMPAPVYTPCKELSIYLIGFYVILILNIVFSLIVASAQSVDNSRNIVVTYSPQIMGFLGFCLIAFNVYGVIVVWNSKLWDNQLLLSSTCIEARNLSVATLSFFFILPLVCLLFGLLGKGTKRATTAEEDSVEHHNAQNKRRAEDDAEEEDKNAAVVAAAAVETANSTAELQPETRGGAEEQV